MPAFAANLSMLFTEAFADNPGRNEPGTGENNFRNVFAAVDRLGYGGWVSAEYRPSGATEASLGWFREEV